MKKFEREIDEIMEQAGGLPSRTRRRQPGNALGRVGRQLGVRCMRALRWVTPPKAGGLGVAVLLGGLIARSERVIIPGLGLLLLAYLLSVARSRPASAGASGYERSWRGKPLEYRAAPGWRERLRRRLGKRR